MIELTIDPALPYVIPATPGVTIALVGCGGTGSHLAQSLARLAAHCHDTGGPAVQLVFVDGDTVEAKNVGRQLFSAADVGKNKAQVLAARFSAVFGLRIVAIPEMLAEAQISAPRETFGLIVGAVDGAVGRQAIGRHFTTPAPWRLWLDCGNHESSGQVCVGSALEARELHQVIGAGLCRKLPAPSLVYPELLKDAPKKKRADCAAAMEDNAQSLMVNQTMAAIAAQYVYQIVVKRRLTTFRTAIDIESLAMRSDPITARALASATGLTPEQLQAPALAPHAKPTRHRRTA